MTRSMDTTASGQKPKPSGRVGGERRLSVVHPPELTTAIALDPGHLVLGREGDGAARLPHRTVSRRHAELLWDPDAGMHRMRDLDSHNGTWIDGRRIASDPTAIIDGTVLRLGDVLLVYEASRTVAPDAPSVSSDAIPGESFAARLLRSEVGRAAPDPSPVLLVGDTGTGKESIAREIHRLSGRTGALVAVNCAALARELVEAQLFGHMRGAFTGAADSQPGLFRAADEGTLFLDEIGELPLDLQPKLLRAIQESEIQPVGAARPIKVDVRIVAATNRDLAADTDSGAFRRDLYARIALWEIRVPPLRARRRDLLAWMDILHRGWRSRRGSSRALELDPDAAEALLLAPWTENLRGVERLIHMIGTELDCRAIGLEDLPDWVLGRVAAAEPEAVEEAAEARRQTPSPDELSEVLALYGGSIRATARHFAPRPPPDLPLDRGVRAQGEEGGVVTRSSRAAAHSTGGLMNRSSGAASGAGTGTAGARTRSRRERGRCRRGRGAGSGATVAGGSGVAATPASTAAVSRTGARSEAAGRTSVPVAGAGGAGRGWAPSVRDHSATAIIAAATSPAAIQIRPLRCASAGGATAGLDGEVIVRSLTAIGSRTAGSAGGGAAGGCASARWLDPASMAAFAGGRRTCSAAAASASRTTPALWKRCPGSLRRSRRITLSNTGGAPLSGRGASWTCAIIIE